jgi:nicotinamide phosphoribosyltransferase
MTRAFEMRKYLENKRDEFGYDDSFLWRFHSFGFRGHKSLEDAYWAGTAWNLFLQGTDDFHIANHMPVGVMGSISALAHKVTQQYDNEYDCFTHTIDATAEAGQNIVAMVIDTYDAWNVINNWVVPLSNYAKEKGVHVVWRPDSGDIFEQAVAIHRIAKENGLTNCTVIIGEGMSFEEAKKFDEKLLEYGVPLNFVNYGIGAGFYKDIERDTLGWAMKTAYSNGEPRMKIVKSNPFKQSIPNMVYLMYNEAGEMVVHNGQPDMFDIIDTLYEVPYMYLNDDARQMTEFMFDEKIGDILVEEVTPDHFDEVRQRALSQNTSQQRIVLSIETQEMIKLFHNKYDKM